MMHSEPNAAHEQARADGLEAALVAVAARMDLFSMLAAAEELRARAVNSPAELEAMDHAAQILDDAASRIALGPIFAKMTAR